jgi:glucose-1-phosphate cytidylyltransferase
MKVVILAGGFGTRISEESNLKPKPLIEIGERPILWHIMKIYSRFGFNDFVICLGYKGYKIKEYFANYFLNEAEVTFDFAKSNEMIINRHSAEPWKVTLVNTGQNTMTGGRLKRVREYVGNETFMFTYGDGLAAINILEQLEFHKQHGKFATVTAVQPKGRFGNLEIKEDNRVTEFKEKPLGDGGWVNGGFFILQPDIFKYIEDDKTVFENAPLSKLAADGQLMAYKHPGFWHPMDTLRDKNDLEEMWKSGNAPWKWSEDHH